MKNIICAVLFCAIFTGVYAQYPQGAIERYFYSQGVRTLAQLAHPTNTYKSGTYRVENNSVFITINYEDGYYTQLKVKREKPFFSNIDVLEDNDFVNPFTAVEFLKNLLLEATKDDSEKEKSKSDFEKRFDKKLENMNGIEVACLWLSLDWLGFPSSN